jgi:hypothetical protein
VSADAEADVAPLVTVVKGAPTPEQLAALVAVVASLRPVGGAADDVAPPAEEPEPVRWGRPTLRDVPAAGPGAWRASGLPE